MTDTHGLGQLLKGAVEIKIQEIIDEEIAATCKRVETKVRDSIGGIAARVLEHFSFERMGQDLVIRVKFEKP